MLPLFLAETKVKRYSKRLAAKKAKMAATGNEENQPIPGSERNSQKLLTSTTAIPKPPPPPPVGPPGKIRPFSLTGLDRYELMRVQFPFEPFFVPRRNEVAEGGYWITLRPSASPFVRPYTLNNFKTFGRILMISHTGL